MSGLRARQRGFTLIELVIAVGVAGLLAAGIIKAAVAENRRGTLEIALEEARTVALVADLFQNRVSASAPDDPITYARTYTYTSAIPNWQNATAALAGSGSTFPANSPYGTAFEVVANGTPARARFVIPAQELQGLNVGGVNVFTEMVGANMRVTVQTIRRPMHARVGFVKSFRSEVLQEELR